MKPRPALVTLSDVMDHHPMPSMCAALHCNVNRIADSVWCAQHTLYAAAKDIQPFELSIRGWAQALDLSCEWIFEGDD